MAENDQQDPQDQQSEVDASVAKAQKAPDSDPKAAQNVDKAAKALEDAQPKLSPNEPTAATADDPDSEVMPAQHSGGPTAAIPSQPSEDEQEKPLRPQATRMVTQPDLAEGQVWEDLAPGHTEAGRRLRVLSVETDEKGKPVADGKVHVRNLQTGVESEIRVDRFRPEEGAFRRAV